MLRSFGPALLQKMISIIDIKSRVNSNLARPSHLLYVNLYSPTVSAHFFLCPEEHTALTASNADLEVFG